jgi:O-antigen/teichoic acid export membrane protein
MIIWKEFLQGTSVSFVIKMIGLALALLSQVALVRWLSTEGFGIYSYVVTLIGLVGVFAQLGLHSSVVRFVAAARVQQAWAQLQGILVISRRLVIISSLCLTVLGELIVWGFSSRLDNSLEITLQIGLLLLPLQTLGTLEYRALRGLKRVTTSLICEDLVIPLIVTFGALLLAPFGVVEPIWAMLLRLGAAFVVVGLGTWWLRRSLPKEAKTVLPEYNLREVFAVSLPLLAAAPMQTVLNRTDIIMLGYLTTMSDVALYTVAQRIAATAILGLVAANVIAAPLISESFAKKDRGQIQAAAFLAAMVATVFTVAFIAFLVLFEEWIFFLFGPDYRAASSLMWILISGQVVNSIAGSVGLLLSMTEHQKRFFGIIAISALVNLVLNAILIPSFGATGAAVSTFITTCLWNGWMCIQVVISFKINPTIFSRRMVSKALVTLHRMTT